VVRGLRIGTRVRMCSEIRGRFMGVRGGWFRGNGVKLRFGVILAGAAIRN
jgi:hypothetical protein